MSLNLLNKQTSRPQLWLARVEGSSDILDSDFLDDSSLQRYNRFTSPSRRQQFLLSRWLIKKAVHHMFGIPISIIKIDENSNSYPDISPLPSPLFYSLSHSDDWAAVVFSDSPCGIDIEKKRLRENMHDMAKSFMSAPEFTHYSLNQSQDYFYQCWCKKEALYKSLSKAEQTIMPFHALGADNALQSTPSTLLEFTSEQYQLTIFDSCAVTTIDAYVVGHPPKVWPPFALPNSIDISWNLLP